MKFLSAVLSFFAGLFAEAKTIVIKEVKLVKGVAGAVDQELSQDVKKLIHLWDEKRFFGAVYLALALALPFVFPGISVQVLGFAVAIGIALLAGVPLGDSIPFLDGLKSMGLADLLTNKANQGDIFRVFGVLFQLAALAYLLTPLWVPTASVVPENLLFLGGVGAILSWGAIWGDHVAVKNEG